MDTTGIDRMLSQLRTAQALASRKPQAAGSRGRSGREPRAISRTRSRPRWARSPALQNDAEQLPEELHRRRPEHQPAGRHDLDAEIDIAFQQAVQVRNKLVQAYHDIMNMQV